MTNDAAPPDATAYLLALISERLPRSPAITTTVEAKAHLEEAAARLDTSARRRVFANTESAAYWIGQDEPIHVVRKLAQALSVFGGATRDRADALANEAHEVLKDLGALPRT